MYLVIHENEEDNYQSNILSEEIMEKYANKEIWLYRFNARSQCFEEYADGHWKELKKR